MIEGNSRPMRLDSAKHLNIGTHIRANGSIHDKRFPAVNDIVRDGSIGKGGKEVVRLIPDVCEGRRKSELLQDPGQGIFSDYNPFVRRGKVDNICGRV